MKENKTVPDSRQKRDRTVSFIAFCVCAVAALVLWIYVMNAENSDYTKTFTVDLQVNGIDTLRDERGLELFSEPSVVTVEITVQGTKVNVMKYSEKDFNASVDLSTVKQSGFSTLNISVLSPSSSVTVNTVTPTTATVFTDVHKTLPITLEAVCIDDTEAKYPNLSVDTNGAEFYLDGPMTEIDRVVRGEATVTVGMLEKGIDGSAATQDIRFFDAEGNEVKLVYSVASQKAVTVSVPALG